MTLFMINTVTNHDSNFAMRLDNRVLGNSKPKNSWQDLTILILLVLKSFIKNRLILKSSDAIWDLLSSKCIPERYKIRTIMEIIHNFYFTINTIW